MVIEVIVLMLFSIIFGLIAGYICWKKKIL